jgi:hypothetical protein
MKLKRHPFFRAKAPDAPPFLAPRMLASGFGPSEDLPNDFRPSLTSES